MSHPTRLAHPFSAALFFNDTTRQQQQQHSNSNNNNCEQQQDGQRTRSVRVAVATVGVAIAGQFFILAMKYESSFQCMPDAFITVDDRVRGRQRKLHAPYTCLRSVFPSQIWIYF